MKKVSEKMLKDYAEGVSNRITLRKTANGNRVDITRKTTTREKSVVGNLVLAGLLAIRSGEADKRAAASTAEYAANLLLKDVNGYDSVFCPIMEFDFSS